jgi:hypothetical protein
LIWIERYTSLKLEEVGVDLWSNAAFHAAEFLHLGTATACHALIIAQTLQSSIAGVVFQNFIFDIKHHLLHIVPGCPTMQPPLRVCAMHKCARCFERGTLPAVEWPVHKLMLLRAVVQLLASATFKRRRHTTNAATLLPAVEWLFAFRVVWVRRFRRVNAVVLRQLLSDDHNGLVGCKADAIQAHKNEKAAVEGVLRQVIERRVNLQQKH